MPTIKLPDGKNLIFSKKITGLEIAEKISKSLSKQALVMSVDDQLKDLSHLIENDCSIKIFTSKDSEGLETIRHDTAHILAMAVQELFPGTQVTIGPVIENGFYYDFARKEPFTQEDLNKIENKMKEIVDRNEPTFREVWKRNKAISHFKDKGEIYKAEIIEGIPKEEKVSIYFHGEWNDLCRGPHLPSTGKVGKFFKLTKVSGAYWRGDSKNEMLQRIYGTSWSTQKDLDNYLKRIEEAEKRDHRKLGKEMNLFHFREESPGSVFWHEKGWILFQKLIDYMRAKQKKAGYKEINTPEILDRSLWEKSGHWEKFGEHMYTSKTPDEKIFAIKPMNCPGCVEVFKQGLKSYRDLPLKISEFGKVHRYEPSGALHGLLRVRAFTQDDAHIFCTQEQVEKGRMDLVVRQPVPELRPRHLDRTKDSGLVVPEMVRDLIANSQRQTCGEHDHRVTPPERSRYWRLRLLGVHCQLRAVQGNRPTGHQAPATHRTLVAPPLRGRTGPEVDRLPRLASCSISR